MSAGGMCSALGRGGSRRCGWQALAKWPVSTSFQVLLVCIMHGIPTARAPHPDPQVVSVMHHHFLDHHEDGLYIPTDFFETSAMIITLILMGKYLECSAKGKTSEAITKVRCAWAGQGDGNLADRTVPGNGDHSTCSSFDGAAEGGAALMPDLLPSQ